MPGTAADEVLERAKLRWRCRRGMKELDLLLLHYLDHEYPSGSAREREAFVRILDLQDPEIFGYLVGRAVPADETLRHVLDRIRHDR